MSATSDQQNAVETPAKLALIKAVENRDNSEVEKLINEGVDVNVADGQGQTALLCAVKNNVDFEIIKALVGKGASVNAKDHDGRSSLFYAVTKSSDTATYLFEKANFKFLHTSADVSSILLFFIESISTKRHDSHPTIDEIVSLLVNKGVKPKKLAKAIKEILLCKIPLLLNSEVECHSSRTSHLMFHLHGERKSFLDILKEVSKCECIEKYLKKENINLDVLDEIEDSKKSISDILAKLLMKPSPNPNFADSYGNTALHYAACLPWMGVPQETVKKICEELEKFSVPLDKRNLQDQTPLLFCLSGSMEHLKEDDKLTAMNTLVKVCEFLVSRGSRLTETTQDGESVFHLVIKLFQQGLEIPNKNIRQGVIDETTKLLDLFSPSRAGQVVCNKDADLLNSPLHLWASLVLAVPDQDYTIFVTQKRTFKVLLKVILDHLLDCGAMTNDKNKRGETPLHVCNTWSAVNLLIQAKANPNDVDSSERPPLLVAASKKTFLRNPSHFYPDVQEEGKPFFETAVKKKLDPWTVDKDDESLLHFLIAYETYDLSKALVEVACELRKDNKISKDESQKIFVSLLKAICKDKSLHTHWKTKLVQAVLDCGVKANDIDVINVVHEPFNVCCKTMISLLNEPLPSSNGTVDESDSVDVEEQQPLLTSEMVGADKAAQKKNYKIQNTVHCEIAQILRRCGAELSGAPYEMLKTKCKEINQILESTPVPVLFPWTSISKTHKNVLDQVARGQDCQEIGGSIYCRKIETPAGSFGADLFVGINKLNSREVAVKCIGEEQCTQDLKSVYAHLNCEQIIRYFLHFKDTEFVYIVFELMEGNLDLYLGSDAYDSSKGASFCGDIVKGLNYLHKYEIRHFENHLKPTSIFYKTHPELCLRITDFDHCQPADGTPNYVWSSPEVLKKLENQSKPSDVFSCGLLLHYILSKGKHPFCTNMDVTETENNTIANNMEGWDNSLCPEAAHLLKAMLHEDKSERPLVDKALDYPFFWSNKKKVDLLTAVANQPRNKVKADLDARKGTILNHKKWNDSGHFAYMPDIHTEMKKRTYYNTSSVYALLRCIRNAYAHVTELPETIRGHLLVDFVCLKDFPNLVIEVYEAVTTHGWDQIEEIKYAMI